MGPAGPGATLGWAKGPIRSCETGSKGPAEPPDVMGVWGDQAEPPEHPCLAKIDGG